MGFLDIGIKRHQGQHRQENLWLLSKVDGDCVTSHGLTAYHLFLGSYFEATLTTGMARSTDTLWSSSELFFTETFTRIYRKYANTNNNSSICRVFVVSPRKSSGKQIHPKTIWLKKNVLKPTLGMKQQVFARNKLKKKQFTQWINGWNRIVIEFLPNLRDFPICRTDPKRDTYHV